MKNNYLSEPITKQSSSFLYNIFTVLFKRKWIIIGFLITVVVLVTVVSLLIPPTFKSSAKLLLEQEVMPERALLFKMNFARPFEHYEWMKAEKEIIKSEAVAAQIVTRLKLDQHHQENDHLSREGIARRFEKTVKNFQQKIKAENVQDINILTVSCEAKDPELVKAMLDTLIDTYINYRSVLSDESRTLKFFNEQVQLTNGRLQQLEQQQADYKLSNEVISPEEQKKILLTRLADFEKTLTLVQTKRISRESKLAVIKKQLETGEEINIPSTETSDSPSYEKHIAKLKGELLDMEIRREFLLQKFTPQYEEIVVLNKQISATRKKIIAEIRDIINMEEITIQAHKTEEKILQSTIDKIKNELNNFTQKEYEYTQISRGIDENREIYSMFLKQREEARIAQAKLERDIKVTVISPPIAPTLPTRPQKALNVMLAILLGLTGGLSIAFFVDYFDHSIITPAELQQNVGLPVLGYVREFNPDRLEDNERNRS